MIAGFGGESLTLSGGFEAGTSQTHTIKLGAL